MMVVFFFMNGVFFFGLDMVVSVLFLKDGSLVCLSCDWGLVVVGIGKFIIVRLIRDSVYELLEIKWIIFYNLNFFICIFKFVVIFLIY